MLIIYTWFEELARGKAPWFKYYSATSQLGDFGQMN